MADVFDPPRLVEARKPLVIDASPFAAGAAGSRLGRPLQAALGQVIRQIGLQIPVVLILGAAGTGKTLLIEKTVRACTRMGLSVRQAKRGGLVETPAGEKLDALFVDDADAMTDSMLQALVTEKGRSLATTIIFAGSPACAGRFSDVHPVIVTLTEVSPSDAQRYLLDIATAAGLPHLFSSDALDLIVHAARGSPRSLRAIAGAAFLGAAGDGASEINLKHVAYALAQPVSADAIGTQETNAPIPAAKEPSPDSVVRNIDWQERRQPQRADISPSIGAGLDRRVRVAALVAGVVIAFAIGSMTPALLASGRPDAGVAVDRTDPIGPLPVSDVARPAAMSIVPAAPTVSAGGEPVIEAPASTAARNADEARTRLTGEEAAAVARGIQEMERAARAVQNPANRR